MCLDRYRKIVVDSPFGWASETAALLTESTDDWLSTVRKNYGDHVTATTPERRSLNESSGARIFLRSLSTPAHRLTVKHIPETALEEYHLGKIPEGRRLAKLEEHLLSCPRCAERAEKAAQYVDAVRSAIVSGNFDWGSLRTAKRSKNMLN